ncbi:MAG TPA: hypothetical protein VHQ02_02435 [Usitatibacter sp.]|jgi:hypothetical protein|nr:hypothetical protein [Usitatibacter sp.]
MPALAAAAFAAGLLRGVHCVGMCGGTWLDVLGESFLCDWLPDAIGHAKARGIPFAFLTTNGSAATPERVRACMPGSTRSSSR